MTEESKKIYKNSSTASKYAVGKEINEACRISLFTLHLSKKPSFNGYQIETSRNNFCKTYVKAYCKMFVHCIVYFPQMKVSMLNSCFKTINMLIIKH